MATATQLAALKKARAARAKKLGKKKAPTKRKTTTKKSVAVRYVVFAKKGSGKRYYLQQINGKWDFNTKVPTTGMPKSTAEAKGKLYGKKLPCGYGVFLEKK